MECRDLSAKLVRELLDYDPKTGELRWKPRPVRPGKSGPDNTWNTRFAGKVAGSPQKIGWQIGINGKLYYLARIVWLHHYGEWPDGFVDHIDGNKGNNLIRNLRDATNAENCRNRGPQTNSTTGLKGVCFDKARNKWKASIMANGKFYNLGRFATPEEAANAYREAAIRLHGEYARA
jgi:hypothetical protein